uniref:Uncharacterized protein n=1 Tax=Kalmanozyma brasiliensis (strain GHG001) TaxID=1365824 RepID=V5EGB7_KALBG
METSQSISGPMDPVSAAILVCPTETSSPMVEPSLMPNHSKDKELSVKEDDVASSDSGSLTQRAALIRDELLGNDSLEQESVHGSAPSSGTSDQGTTHSSLQDDSCEDKDDLEERLRNSSISQSLRHIALAYDEKSRELESLRTTLRAELDELTASQEALRCELETLKSEVEHKDELLCFSDRISCRLFNMMHAIRAQVEEAESLSPAIRSLSSSSTAATSDCGTPSTITTISDSEAPSAPSSESSDESDTTLAPSDVPTPFETLIKKIEAKYADQMS